MIEKFNQLTLDILLKDYATLDNFIVGSNLQLFTDISGLAERKEAFFIYYWGNAGVGKTHLLNALCRDFAERKLTAAFLPLDEHQTLAPEIIDEYSQLDLVAIDNLEQIAGDTVWEEKIFHCFNQIILNGKKMVITSCIAPQFLSLNMQDLKSRLLSGLAFNLKELTDSDKIQALQLRAKLRGFELNENVASFLLNRCSRRTSELFAILDKLDQASLVAHRRLTIPFVKDILGQNL